MTHIGDFLPFASDVVRGRCWPLADIAVIADSALAPDQVHLPDCRNSSLSGARMFVDDVETARMAIYLNTALAGHPVERFWGDGACFLSAPGGKVIANDSREWLAFGTVPQDKRIARLRRAHVFHTGTVGSRSAHG